MSEEYRGPSAKTLAFLHQSLPEFTQGVIESKASGKGIKIKPPPLMPSKHCAICTRLYDFVSKFESELKKGFCPDCQKMLDGGSIALIADDNSDPKRPARKFMFIDRKFLRSEIAANAIRIPISEFEQVKKNAEQNTQSRDAA